MIKKKFKFRKNDLKKVSVYLVITKIPIIREMIIKYLSNYGKLVIKYTKLVFGIF